jgi:hypothetical protein
VVLLVDFIAPPQYEKNENCYRNCPCKYRRHKILGQKRRTFDSPNKRLDQRYLVDGLCKLQLEKKMGVQVAFVDVRQNHSDGKPHLHREQILVEQQGDRLQQ